MLMRAVDTNNDGAISEGLVVVPREVIGAARAAKFIWLVWLDDKAHWRGWSERGFSER